MGVAGLLVWLAVSALALLTAVGSYRRNGRLVVAIVVGCVFPATWIAWYVKDDLRRAPQL